MKLVAGPRNQIRRKAKGLVITLGLFLMRASGWRPICASSLANGQTDFPVLRPDHALAGIAQLRPGTERDADTGAGRGPIERLVFEPATFHALDSAGKYEPVADLGRAGIERRDRQGAQEFGPPGLKAFNHAAVQVLIDNEMAEATRGHHGDAQVLLAGLDASAQRPADIVAA